MDKVRVSFSYPEGTKKKLTKLAVKDGRKLQGYIKSILLMASTKLKKGEK